MPLDLRLDFSGVSDGVFPAGTYEATVGGFEVRENKNKDGSHVNVKFELDVNGAKRVLSRNFSLKSESLWAFKQFLIRAGYPGDKLTGMAEIDETLVQGNKVLVVVTEDEWEGEKRNNIDKVLQAQGATAGANGSKSKGW